MNEKQPRVVTTGTFDGPLHEGHLNLLARARAMGHLTVAIAHDKVIREYKKRDPIFPQAVRMKNVAEHADVVAEMLEDEMENIERILALNPDIYVFTDDQGRATHHASHDFNSLNSWNQELERRLRERGVEIRWLPRTPGVSTSELLEKAKVTKAEEENKKPGRAR